MADLFQTVPDSSSRILMRIGPGRIRDVTQTTFVNNYVNSVTVGTTPDSNDAVLMSIDGKQVAVTRAQFLAWLTGPVSGSFPDLNDKVMMSVGGRQVPVSLTDYLTWGFLEPSAVAGYIFGANPADITCAVDDGTGSCLRLNDLYDKGMYIGAAPGGFAPEIEIASGISGAVRLLRFNDGTADFMSSVYGANNAALVNMWNQGDFRNGNGYCMFAYRCDGVGSGALDGVLQWGALSGTKLQYRIAGGVTPNVGVSYVQTGQATQFVQAAGGTVNWEIAEISKVGSTINIYVNRVLVATGTVPVNASMANSEFGLGWNPGPQAIYDGYIGPVLTYSATPTAAEINSLYARITSWLSAPQFSAEEFLDSIGVNCHFGQTGTPYVTDYAATRDGIADLGVRLCREDVILELANGTVIDPTAEYTRMLGVPGVKWQVVCFDRNNASVYTPPAALNPTWVQGGVTKPGIPTALGSRLKRIEGSNEPNISGNTSKADESWQHQKDMWTIYTANPQYASAGITIAGPSYISSGNQWNGARDATGTCQLGNIHPYPGSQYPETALVTVGIAWYMAAARFIYPTQKYVFSEDGYNTDTSQAVFGPVNPALRARYINRMPLWNWVNGAVATLLYEGRASFDPANPPVGATYEAFFGLMAFDGTKTPAFFAIKNLLATMAAYVTPGAKAAPGKITAYGDPHTLHANFVRGDGRNVMALWLGVSSGGTTPNAALNVATQVELLNAGMVPEVRRFDDAGAYAVSTLPLTNGRATLNASDQLTLIIY